MLSNTKIIKEVFEENKVFFKNIISDEKFLKSFPSQNAQDLNLGSVRFVKEMISKILIFVEARLHIF